MKASVIRLPTGGLFELEFTAGVWTNVTADVDQGQSSVTMKFGRSSEFSTPQVADFNVVLRNNLGNYTPQNQASPYWPNIQPRKRIRYSYNPGTQRFRFTGYINSWQPLMVDAYRPYMAVTATDRMGQLSRVHLLSPIRQEITLDGPALWWPLTDAAGSFQALEQSGNNAPPLGVTGTGAALVFGDAGPGFGDGTGAHFAAGIYLTGPANSVVARTFTVEFWFNITAAPGAAVAMVTLDRDQSFTTSLGPITIGLNTSRNVTVTHESGTITSSTVASVNGWHHVALTRDFASSGYVLYLDGVNVGSATGLFQPGNWAQMVVGQSAAGAAPALYSGNLGQFAIYNSVLSTTRIAAHYQAGLGYYGDTTDQRIARFLAYAGLTGSDWNLDAGQAVVNTYPQDGKDVLSACQDIASTEGGGAALYVTPDGKVRFVNRRYRDNRTPKLTLDAVNDLDPSIYSPSFDDVTLQNQATVDRSAESGTLTSQTYKSPASISQYGLFAAGLTTYTTSDGDAVNLAQYTVAAQMTLALRFPQIAVDLALAGTDLYNAIGQLQIGDRIRVVNIPATAYPLPTLDFFLEGWSETAGVDSYKVVFDVTAADNPPRWKWNTSRWNPTPGSMTLNAALSTPIATTVVVATSAGNPTFTTAGGSYPLSISVGEEDITFNSAPGGSSSPQTFTGCTRGANGTPAAPQAAGSAVNLASADTWAL